MSTQLQGFAGINNIIYPNGYYQGQIYNGVAHGQGTYYFRDGTIYRGNFYDGWRNGPGVLIVPYRGYLPSCWNMGSFIGQQCTTGQQSLPTFNTSSQVKQVVSNTYNEFPQDASFVATDPDNYDIVQIDSNTQLGKTLLGKYSGN
ncbi:hypothetical protein [Algibacter lectus]|uniref:hypothetical protein n=1 Tax=Algibacter lectus TaxID=221126 RepID=UPI0026F21B9E|nr:hypothetical protein [Algibacter lectus]MDO7138143.1 hypothetical protein [Algibacter lectus]